MAKCQFSENLNLDFYTRAEKPRLKFSSFVEEGFLFLNL